MPKAEATNHRFNPSDVTEVWSQKHYPLIEVGTIEQHRNPKKCFADVEQAAFTSANVVPGIGFSPNHLLQGRLFHTVTRSAIASASITTRSRLMRRVSRAPIHFIATAPCVPTAILAAT